MPEYKTPGVYVEEIPKLPPSIASVETAIPAFIGYTEKAQLKEPGDLRDRPKRISSMIEFEQFFGQPQMETTIKVTVDSTQTPPLIIAKVDTPSKYLMSYSLQMFFANGGGDCYIVSIGDYSTGVILYADLKRGLDKTDEINEITLLLFPDSLGLTTSADFYTIHKDALDKCFELQDRFTVLDVWIDPDPTADNIQVLRDSGLGAEIDKLKYGAVYYPRIETILDYFYNEDVTQVTQQGGAAFAGTMTALKTQNNALYWQVKSVIANVNMILPASSAVVGKYAATDNSRGVWKAPANVNIDYAVKPVILVTSRAQAGLNVDAVSGKSINVIRTFPGRGNSIIWGARTLAGNDNEWRYVPVRRFFIMVEESTKNATEQFVFEPNDRNTWVRVKSMIENYLTQQWKAGALMGTTTREAFFVHVGLGETMTEQDIFEGRMIVEIGMAVVRPAEFIILRFMHKMLGES